MRIPFPSSSFNFFSMFWIFWNSIVRREISVPRIWVRSTVMLSFTRTCTTDLTKLNTNNVLTNTTSPCLVRNWPRSPANNQRSQRDIDHPIGQTSCVSSEVQYVDSSTLEGKTFPSIRVWYLNFLPWTWSWSARDVYLTLHRHGSWILLLNFWLWPNRDVTRRKVSSGIWGSLHRRWHTISLQLTVDRNGIYL